VLVEEHHALAASGGEPGSLTSYKPNSVKFAGTRSVPGGSPRITVGELPAVGVRIAGGGKVGRAVTRALREREVSVHIVERDPELQTNLSEIADRVFTGDAADLDVVMEAASAFGPSTVGRPRGVDRGRDCAGPQPSPVLLIDRKSTTGRVAAAALLLRRSRDPTQHPAEDRGV
jgi:hypothetical protein